MVASAPDAGVEAPPNTASWYAAAAEEGLRSDAASPDTWDASRGKEARSRLEAQMQQRPTRSDELVRSRWTTQPGRYWDSFYASNLDGFFKDRHYLADEFPIPFAMAAGDAPGGGGSVWVLDFGCGVGNAAVPLLRSHPRLRIVGFDISRKAVSILADTRAAARRDGEEWASRLVGRIPAHDCTAVEDDDSSVGSLPPVADPLAPAGGCPPPVRARGGFDAVLMIFVLSAVPPGRDQLRCLTAACRALRPGGRLLFRDYASLDEAQLRFSGRARMPDGAGSGGGGAGRLYARGDGTLSYFFEPGELVRLARAAGMRVVELRPVLRRVVNRRSGVVARRVWLHCVMQKPPPGILSGVFGPLAAV